MEIAEVIAKQGMALLDVPGVLEVSQTEVDGKPAIRVVVEEGRAEARNAIPPAMDGYPVLIEASDAYRAQKSS